MSPHGLASPVATTLLILHGLVAVALLGAITHQAVATWAPARTGPRSFFGSFRAVRAAKFATAVVVLYCASALLTRSCCPCRHRHPPADHVRFKGCLSEPGSAGGSSNRVEVIEISKELVEPVQVRRSACHHAAVVGADVPDADIVPHDDDDVLRGRRCARRYHGSEQKTKADVLYARSRVFGAR